MISAKNKILPALLFILFFFSMGAIAANETEIHREEFTAVFNGPSHLSCNDIGSNIVKLNLNVLNTDMPDDIEHYSYYTFVDVGFELPINCDRFADLLSDTAITVNGLHIVYQHDEMDENGNFHTFDVVKMTFANYPGIIFFNK